MPTLHNIGHYEVLACQEYGTFLGFIECVENMILSVKYRYFKEDTWLYFGISKMNTISSNKLSLKKNLIALQDAKFLLYSKL